MNNKTSFSLYIFLFLVTSCLMGFIQNINSNIITIHYEKSFFIFFLINSLFLIYSNFFLIKSDLKEHKKNHVILSIFLFISLNVSFLLYNLYSNTLYLLISALIVILLNISALYNLNIIYKNDKFYNIYLTIVKLFLIFGFIFNLLFNSIILIDILPSTTSSEIAKPFIISIFNYLLGIFIYIESKKNVNDIELDYKDLKYFLIYICYLFILFIYPFIFVFFITLK